MEMGAFCADLRGCFEMARDDDDDNEKDEIRTRLSVCELSKVVSGEQFDSIEARLLSCTASKPQT